VAVNATGTTVSATATFTTVSTAPSASTLAATATAAHGTNLQASLRPNGAATTVYFEYGPTTAYGSVTVTITLAAAAETSGLSDAVAGLLAGTSYHFRVVAVNALGTTYGADQAFTTLAAESVVLTFPATPVGLSDATLHGAATLIAGDGPLYFEYGPTAAYGGTVAATLSTAPDRALSFDGVDDAVTIPFGNAAPTTEITIEFWQKVTAAKNQSTFVLNGNATLINAYIPWSDGVVYWDFGGSRLSYTPPQSIVGTWQHFALVASQRGNTMRIYRNGVLEASRVG